MGVRVEVGMGAVYIGKKNRSPNKDGRPGLGQGLALHRDLGGVPTRF
jgi:hypothetical protein